MMGHQELLLALGNSRALKN